MSRGGAGADPRDTLVVVGGRPLDRVDTAGIALAAARLDGAAAALRTAAAGCSTASADLERSAWAPALGTPDPVDAAVRRRAAWLAADVARRLHERASACALTGERLLRAVGLYAHAESAAERVLGGAVAGTAALSGVLVAAPVLPRALRVTGVLGPGVLGGLVALAPGKFASWSDEVVAGLGAGVGAGAPVRSGLDLSVTGAARVLVSVVRELVGRTQVRVLETSAAGFASGRPAWAGTPSSTVAEALARTADLYPWGSGVPGRPAPGAPAGTLAVERVEHADGSVSWTVLVPGTQGLVSARHPFDGVTDLDLMAERAAEVTAAVSAALAQSGARPEEPVVLVGHSLGGIAAVALASSPAFLRRHRLGGVVTAGAPTATFVTPPGVPVLHLENDEELVSSLDGRSATENPGTVDRVTVGRALRESDHPDDVAASGAVAAAHGMATHLRTLDLARASGSAQAGGVVARLERLLAGGRSTTRFYAARRSVPDDGPDDGPLVLAPAEGPLSPSSGRTVR